VRCRDCAVSLNESSSPVSEGGRDLAFWWAEARQFNINDVKKSLEEADVTQKYCIYWHVLLNWSALFALNRLVHSLSILYLLKELENNPWLNKECIQRSDILSL